MTIFRSASFKLTVFYVLIVMIISVAFSAAVYQISAEEIGTCMNRPTTFLRQLPAGNPFHSMLGDLDKIRGEQLAMSRNHLLTNLIYFNLMILVLSSVASYFFARKTLKPIEEMMETQSRFTADASHELKTPLTAMKSEIEVTLRDKKLGSSDAKKLLASNLEEIGKLESLSNALLELARYENKAEKNFEELSLPDIATTAFEKVEKLALMKKIEFETRFRDLKLKGDEQSLTELFVILFDNAIKYSPEKSKIEVIIRKEMRHGEIQIKDHGAGIKKEDLPHIFDRFYRADTARKKDAKNSYGLGLAIAKSIVDFHGGSISAESKAGEGSTFTIKLPLS
jgi:signal transduction histidine kinase